MTQSLSGQNVFSEDVLDGIYIGLRQGAYYEQKAKEQEKTLRLFDSLTTGYENRLMISSKKEENYLIIIEGKDAIIYNQNLIKGLEIKTIKRKNRKWLFVVGASGFAFGLAVAIAN